jgi:hypothetical protein
MAEDRHIYGEVQSPTSLKQLFRAIRRDVKQAQERPGLTELYKRAGYLITLTHSPAWEEKFGTNVQSLRQIAGEEFVATARMINRRAKQVGTAADYDETWGD